MTRSMTPEPRLSWSASRGSCRRDSNASGPGEAGVTVEWGGQLENFTRAPASSSAMWPPSELAVIFAMLFLMFGGLR